MPSLGRMSEGYSWTYQDADGSDIQDLGLSATTFPTQAEAEAWLSEGWTTLADAGVSQVTLVSGDQVVYGPMSLSPAE